MEQNVVEQWRHGGKARERLVQALVHEGALAWATRLQQGGREERRLAATLLGYAQEVEPALQLLRGLVADEDRYTREAAVQAVGKLLERDFPRALAILSEWRRDNPKVRRAAVLAVAHMADRLHMERAGPSLQFIRPLVGDPSPEVGPAVSAALVQFLQAWPDETFEELAAWSAEHDEPVLQQVAQTLGQTPPSLIRKALIVLRRLALDERKAVRQAVVKALRRLAEVQSDVVFAELRRWLPDEDRAPVARATLSRL